MKSLVFISQQESSDEECSTSGSEDKEYAMAVRDLKKFFKRKEPDEWIKDSGFSKHMTGNRNLFSSYKAYNGGNVIFGSNLRGNVIGKGQICDNKCRVTFSEYDSEITKDGKVIGYSQNCKAYIILNKHTRKVKESLNVTFDKTPTPSKSSPLVDDDLDEEEAIKVTEKKNLENDIMDETLEIDKIVNIKKSRNHPLENVIGNLHQRTLKSQAQNQRTKWVFRNKLDENGIVSRNKARLVAQGYNQQAGIDYDENYASVARLELIRILLAYAYALDFKLFQTDVKSAFMNSFINEKKRPHDSNASSSSTTLNHLSSSHPLDDTLDEIDDESFHSNSSSPSQNISSSSNVVFRVRQNPPHESHNLNSYLSETINLQTQQRDAHREGLRSIGQALKNMMGGKRK
nr:hypothetical protein [Tanacetum cinerariifolium]